MTGGRAVVLGPTGRNFGAGMSGGYRHVHDREGIAPARLNGEMVVLDDLDDDDRAFLRDVVERHSQLTGSAVAARLLADWETSVELFRKVMPLTTSGCCR